MYNAVYTFPNENGFLQEYLGGTYLKIKGDQFKGGTVEIITDIPCRGKTRKVFDTADDLTIVINGYRFGMSEFELEI